MLEPLLLVLLAWRIPAYEIQVEVHSDHSLTVHEHYTVDFRQDPHHGIYRQIPVFYRRGVLFQNLRVRPLEVLRNGQPEPYQVRLQGRNLVIRIGSPHRWLQEVAHYDLVYTVRYGLDAKGDRVYLYFNAIGPQWSVPLERGRVVVTLPPDTPYEAAHAWLGPPGSREARIPARPLDARHLVFEPQEAVLPGRALTVWVAFPRGFFVGPDPLLQGIHLLEDNLFLVLPLGVLLLLLGAWHRWGRDPAVRRSVVVRYDPPEDLTPGEAGVLLDERANSRDLAATALDLARRGYLRLEVEPVRVLFFTLHRFRFHLLNPDFSGLKTHERELLGALFPWPREAGQVVDQKDLRQRLRGKVSKLLKTFEQVGVQAGYFPMRPSRVRTTVFSLGLLTIVASFALAVAGWIPVPMMFSLALSGVLVLLFSPIMPRKTRRGVQKYLELKGFEEFLRRVEQDQIRQMGRDADAYFSRLLPYALVFGLEHRLLEVFDGLLSQSPTWCQSTTGEPLSLHEFGASFASTLGSFQSVFSAASRGGGVSGGGSAGGGIGGGGGGAW